MAWSPTARTAAILGLSMLGAGALLAVTHRLTLERAEQNERQALTLALNGLVPKDRRDNDMLEDPIVLHPAHGPAGEGPLPVYRARVAGRITTVAFAAVAPDGYNGRIDLLVAVRRDGELDGVRVVTHHETPGLGDGIEAGRSNWIHQFDGKSLGAPPPARWAVKKDGGEFDQLTGATITPRAVVAAVKRALEFARDHHEELFEQR